MKLSERPWKKFRVSDIFDVVYGVNLELNACQETTKDDHEAVNFVSRARDNNGVTAYIKPINGQSPQSEGIITVAGGGSSVLSTFVQIEPFYSGRDLYLLIPKDCYKNISLLVKLFLCKIIDCNKYKYSYGRQANRTLGKIVIEIPVNVSGEPDWQFMDDYIKSLHSKPVTTKNKAEKVIPIDASGWENIRLADYFDIVPGKYHYPEEYEDGSTPYYSASNENNGIAQYISLKPDFEGNCIVTGKIGCTAFYAPEAFCATSDVNVFKPKFKMSQYIGLFIAAIINFSENYKWAYGRQCRVGDSKNIFVKLPINSSGEPDWQYMEDYIKSLPYGDRI